MRWRMNVGVFAAVMIAAVQSVVADPLPEWTARIRQDHPRLFFNAETWPHVRQRALGEESAWYDEIRRSVDAMLPRVGTGEVEPRDLGPQAARSAFVFLVTDEPRYLELAKRCLESSLRYYEQCYEERKTVNWYSTSRVHAVLAWDWLYNHLAEQERAEIMGRLVRVVDRVLKVKPPIYRENLSGHASGFYGVRNTCWFIGCTAFGAKIEPELVNQWLVWGHDENLRMLEHRRNACGDDGGGASATLGYVLGAYPWAEQNFFYTWLSSTGENIAPDWPHGAWLANYAMWTAIPAQPAPLEFGYGDTLHETNRLPVGQLYTHMANIRHLYAERALEAAALARYFQETLPQQTYSNTWFIYPFLLSRLEESPPPLSPSGLPSARHFESMGQVFMRSGTGPDDTYALFSCGGILNQHRHYDALNFVIYHRGFLALDSGTRHDEFRNGQHLANYFAQTVAHNCVVIHQPGEPPARYWGGTVEGNHGGQHQALGSVVKGFRADRDFVYVAGDATACYQHGGPKLSPPLPQKCSLAARQIVFLLPRHFVIFDRVTTTDPSYRKDWLLHTAHQPQIEGRTFRADHGQGRLVCRTFLPEDARLAAVGGPGKEFWAAGRNWEIAAPTLKPQQRAMMGQWRVEVSPGKPDREDLFLHVIEVGDQGLAAASDAQLVRDDRHCGVRLDTNSGTWEITFATDGDLSGRLRRSGGRGELDVTLGPTVEPQSGIMAGK